MRLDNEITIVLGKLSIELSEVLEIGLRELCSKKINKLIT